MKPFDSFVSASTSLWQFSHQGNAATLAMLSESQVPGARAEVWAAGRKTFGKIVFSGHVEKKTHRRRD